MSNGKLAQETVLSAKGMTDGADASVIFIVCVHSTNAPQLSIILYNRSILDAPQALMVSALVIEIKVIGSQPPVTVPPAAINAATVVKTGGAFSKHRPEPIGGHVIAKSAAPKVMQTLPFPT